MVPIKNWRFRPQIWTPNACTKIGPLACNDWTLQDKRTEGIDRPSIPSSETWVEPEHDENEKVDHDNDHEKVHPDPNEVAKCPGSSMSRKATK